MRVITRIAAVGLFFLVSSLVLCPRIPNQLIAASGAPDIVVDGDIGDWDGVQPIVNDTGDVSSLSSTYDLTECYVYADPGWFYFLFKKTPVGSAVWVIYFDVDSSDQTGYWINDMGADFSCSLGGEQGFYNWTDDDWHSIDSSGTQSAWGSAGSVWSNSTEWYEGRITMDALGNPGAFRVVFQIKHGVDVAPKTGYVTVVNDGFAFAVSFTSPRHVLSRNETSDLMFRIQNHGPVDIGAASVQIAVSPPLGMVSGATLWNGSISSGQTVDGHVTTQALAYGTSISNATFRFDTGSPQTFTIPLTIITAPRIALETQLVTGFRLGAAGTFKVTVTNLDPYEAETTVETMSHSDIGGFYVHAVLAPSSTQQVLHNVTLTEVGGFFFDIHAVFEGVELNRTSVYVDVLKPNIWISAANVTTVMQLGAAYPLTVTIQNDEDYAYSVNVSAAFDHQQPDSAEYLTVDMPARSARTVTLEVRPREQGTHSIDVSLTMYEVALSTRHLYGIDVQPNYLVPLALGVITIGVIATSAFLLARRRRRRSRREEDTTSA